VAGPQILPWQGPIPQRVNSETSSRLSASKTLLRADETLSFHTALSPPRFLTEHAISMHLLFLQERPTPDLASQSDIFINDPTARGFLLHRPHPQCSQALRQRQEHQTILVNSYSSVLTSVKDSKKPTRSCFTLGLASRAEPSDLERIAARRDWCSSCHRLPVFSPFSIHPWRWHSRPFARSPSAIQPNPCRSFWP
jgi:hypothetical protein